MKGIEWFIAGFLVIMGLICLTVSGTFIIEPESIRQYFDTFINLCFWMGLPVLVVGLIYYIILVKRKRGKKK